MQDFEVGTYSTTTLVFVSFKTPSIRSTVRANSASRKTVWSFIHEKGKSVHILRLHVYSKEEALFAEHTFDVLVRVRRRALVFSFVKC